MGAFHIELGYLLMWASQVGQYKESAYQCRRPGFGPWVGKSLWKREWQPTLIFLLGESHGQRSLVGYSLWDHKELDTAEHTQQRSFNVPPVICL